MSKKKRVLICEFHSESNTFNPIPMSLVGFQAGRYEEGDDLYQSSKKIPCAFHGMVDAVEEAGGEVIPTISLYGPSGGRVQDEVFNMLCGKLRTYIAAAGNFDAIFVSLHGATCTESEDDACGTLLEFLRELIGEEKIIAASCDLHGNITERMLRAADIICGYQSYPHVDFYETGYRAAKLGMQMLAGKKIVMAAASIPLMVPPAGYTSLEEPFKGVIDMGKELVCQEDILDFTAFLVQPWLDIPHIASTALVIAEDEGTAIKYADELARKICEIREGCWPELMEIDKVIDRAENINSVKPVILVDSADSPNGGAVGDSVAVALRLLERGSKIRAGMFVRDPEAVRQAFAVGVGGSAEFKVGAGFTVDMPGPLTAAGTVCSLHDGRFQQEGPAGRGFPCHVGLSAVVRFGNIDIMLCEEPNASGDPQILRHFGIEPTLYDLIVVKANTSFLVPYSRFASEFCYADTPGAGSSNLKRLNWKHLPEGLYPFDQRTDMQAEPARVCRRG